MTMKINKTRKQKRQYKTKKQKRRYKTRKQHHFNAKGGVKEIIDISKCHIEIYYGATIYKKSQTAIDYRAVDESKELQNKFKSYIEQLMADDNEMEVRVGVDEEFETKLTALDENICETTHREGSLAKKEISKIRDNMSSIHGDSNNICFLLFYLENIIGICNISLPLLNDDENKIYIEYLCGSNYKYSGTILLNIVKKLFFIGDFEKILLVSYGTSIKYYEKMGFKKIQSDVPTLNPKMIFEK